MSLREGHHARPQNMGDGIWLSLADAKRAAEDGLGYAYGLNIRKAGSRESYTCDLRISLWRKGDDMSDYERVDGEANRMSHEINEARNRAILIDPTRTFVDAYEGEQAEGKWIGRRVAIFGDRERARQWLEDRAYPDVWLDGDHRTVELYEGGES